MENTGCITSAVVIMTTADGMHPAFSDFFFISDIYRLLTEIIEVHYTPVTLKPFCTLTYGWVRKHDVRVNVGSRSEAEYNYNRKHAVVLSKTFLQILR